MNKSSDWLHIIFICYFCIISSSVIWVKYFSFVIFKSIRPWWHYGTHLIPISTKINFSYQTSLTWQGVISPSIYHSYGKLQPVCNPEMDTWILLHRLWFSFVMKTLFDILVNKTIWWLLFDKLVKKKSNKARLRRKLTL